MDGNERPRDLEFHNLMQNDMSAAELYALLPEEVQLMVQQRAVRLNGAADMERLMDDYLDGI